MSQAVGAADLGSGGFLRRRKLIRKPKWRQGSAELTDSICAVAIVAPTEEATVAQGGMMRS